MLCVFIMVPPTLVNKANTSLPALPCYGIVIAGAIWFVSRSRFAPCSLHLLYSTISHRTSFGFSRLPIIVSKMTPQTPPASVPATPKTPKTPRAPRTPKKPVAPPVQPGWWRSTPLQPGGPSLSYDESVALAKSLDKKRKAEQELEGTPSKKGKVDKGKKKAAAAEEVDGTGKKVSRAVKPKWADMPNWGDRKDCPLLERFHSELLDKCFNPRQGLAVSSPYLLL